jgi:autotransporter-associated beta strand protein
MKVQATTGAGCSGHINFGKPAAVAGMPCEQRRLLEKEEEAMNTTTIGTGKKSIRGRGLSAAFALAALSGATVRGASLTWDIDPGTSGAQIGDGTWTDGAGNWWDGSANANWNNATPDGAAFTDTAAVRSYTVTLGSHIVAASIERGGGYTQLITIAPDAGGLYSLTLNGNFTMTRGMQIDAPLVLAGGVTHGIGGAYPLIINGDITETGGANALTAGFGPTVRLTGNNSFSGGLLGGTAEQSGRFELGTDTAAGTGPLRLGRDNIWAAINGNRTLANSWVLALATTRGQTDWSVTFAGDELDFTTTDILRLEGLHTVTSSRWRFIVDNPKTTLAGGIDNGTVAAYRMGIVKEGTGTLVINGNSSFDGDLDYTEAITVKAGALILNGTVFSNDGTSGQKGTIVESSGTLGGTGTLNLAPGQAVTVQAGGTLAPGSNGVGTFTVNGAVTLQSGGLYAWQYLDGTGDLVDVNGTLTLPAAATVNVSGSGALPATMTLFTATTLDGATDLSGWTVTGLEYGKAQIQGTSVILKSVPAGTVITIR